MSGQLTLFGVDDAGDERWAPPAHVAALGQTLRDWPVYLGTSSWTFPGWAGLVYPPGLDRDGLRRQGLTHYARYPLFRAAGVDRTFYGPMTAGQLADYAEQVPRDFRFVVKANRELTTPAGQLPSNVRRSAADRFLDADFARRTVIEPLIVGLGQRAEGVIFQFPPLPRRLVAEPHQFLQRLQSFLAALAGATRCLVEIRNPELYCLEYFAALKSAGAEHCFTVHPGAPTIAAQRQLAGVSPRAGVLVRWNLRRDRRYAEARDAFAPFNQLVAEDSATREEITALVVEAVIAGSKAVVLANNKAEGSAPMTLEKLGHAVSARLRQARGAAP